jgi:predicted RNase H-like nuclease
MLVRDAWHVVHGQRMRSYRHSGGAPEADGVLNGCNEGWALRALGVDLAWSDNKSANETGVVAVETDGTIVDAGWTIGVEETIAWANAQAGDSAVLFVDAPLLVLNPIEQRLCEKQVGQRYGRWKVSANSTNLGSPRLAGVRLRHELESAGWTYSDGVPGPPRTSRIVSECYPYTTIVGADVLGYEQERPLYKRKPKGMAAADWRPVRGAACDVLVQRLSDLCDAYPALSLRLHPVTAQLLDEGSPLNDRAYKHREDLIDACVSAWTALLWIQRGTCQVLGASDVLVDDAGRRATIIAPARPLQRRAALLRISYSSARRRRDVPASCRVPPGQSRSSEGGPGRTRRAGCGRCCRYARGLPVR